MKSLIQAVAIAAILAAPVAAFAQAADTAQQPVTRAEVKNQLIQLEQAGYNPSILERRDLSGRHPGRRAARAGGKSGGGPTAGRRHQRLWSVDDRFVGLGLDANHAAGGAEPAGLLRPLTGSTHSDA